MNGILLIDKPTDISSAKIVAKVKKKLHCKVGHSGTLDPLATGMLPLTLGEATKVNAYMLSQSKQYLATIQLGIKTNTADIIGQVVKQSPIEKKHLSLLAKTVNNFLGESYQIPPAFSALKHQGKPLYHFARQGIEVKKPARKIVIHSIVIISQSTDELVIRVHCSKGTYIRQLAEDIGDKLGCGACIKELHREWCDPFANKSMTDLNIIEKLSVEEIEQLLIPMDFPLNEFIGLPLNSSQTEEYLMGKKISNIQITDAQDNDLFRAYFKNDFLGLAIYKEGNLRAKKVMYKRP